jgi:hypothetical protein
MNESKATAVHEAGHAVAGYLLRRPFSKVSIGGSGDEAGYVTFEPLDVLMNDELDVESDPEIIRYLDREIIILLAGPEAESRYAGRYDFEGAARDWEQVHKYAARLYGLIFPHSRRRFPHVDYSKAHLQVLLGQPGVWPAILAVAQGLMTRTKLRYQDVEEIIQTIPELQASLVAFRCVPGLVPALSLSAA